MLGNMHRIPLVLSPPLLLGVALASTGCGEHVPLGAISTDGGALALLWKATFEPGDLSEWTAGGAGGSLLQAPKLVPTVTTDEAHAGHFAGKLTVAPVTNMLYTNYLFRNAPSPREGYYSAWFYIPSTFTVKTWLSLMHFNCSTTGDGRNVYARWDLNIYNSPTLGALVAHVYDYVNVVNQEQAVPIPVPRDTWVHFEVLLAKAATAVGRVAVWQDNVPILDKPNVVTAPNDWVQWNVGMAVDGVDPSPAFLYLDDAAISVSRLGSAALPWP